MKYDYIKTFVTNVKGLDKDIEFMGTTFNFAEMDGVKLDKALKTILFNVEFPDANTIKYSCYYKGQNMSMEAPIVVDGNKMTVKMSEKNAAYKDVDLYTFQDNTQMHMYMHSTGFLARVNSYTIRGCTFTVHPLITIATMPMGPIQSFHKVQTFQKRLIPVSEFL